MAGLGIFLGFARNVRSPRVIRLTPPLLLLAGDPSPSSRPHCKNIPKQGLCDTPVHLNHDPGSDRLWFHRHLGIAADPPGRGKGPPNEAEVLRREKILIAMTPIALTSSGQSDQTRSGCDV
jgi:hypothetical protein